MSHTVWVCLTSTLPARFVSVFWTVFEWGCMRPLMYKKDHLKRWNNSPKTFAENYSSNLLCSNPSARTAVCFSFVSVIQSHQSFCVSFTLFKEQSCPLFSHPQHFFRGKQCRFLTLLRTTPWLLILLVLPICTFLWRVFLRCTNNLEKSSVGLFHLFFQPKIALLLIVLLTPLLSTTTLTPPLTLFTFPSLLQSMTNRLLKLLLFNPTDSTILSHKHLIYIVPHPVRSLQRVLRYLPLYFIFLKSGSFLVFGSFPCLWCCPTYFDKLCQSCSWPCFLKFSANKHVFVLFFVLTNSFVW